MYGSVDLRKLERFAVNQTTYTTLIFHLFIRLVFFFIDR